MEREIKFRGRRAITEKEPGKWEYGILILKKPSIYVPVFSKINYPVIWNESGVYSVDPETVGEFTNLNDKNGKEIYEGDRVNGGMYNGSYRIGVVKFYNGEFLLFPEGRFAEGVCELVFPGLEIIGNIHDNPDLLPSKETKE